ncbi:MAG TPA: lipid-A-disaccharide synthase [Gammaproteobacteria bacterium]|nr:lipid-A-disaccharide synthase [Gammaproteobacteria bacterium]
MTCIALVAGEASGDLLGASLIQSLKSRYPDAEFIGIAGPEMIKAGCESLYPMESLSVMGLTEVVRHLPELLKIRRNLLQKLLKIKPDVFIGIDAPDFNLKLEKKLKHKGIKTVHYVSPSVWAWRQWRVKKIASSIDLMLTLFPFEVPFYEKNNVHARFVGHPLADMIPLEPDMMSARKSLAIDQDKKVLAILPGSRMPELERLSNVFIGTATLCHQQNPALEFIVPFANQKTMDYFQGELDESEQKLPITLVLGNSRQVMQASDAVLLASGTAALEALLLKKPMVVAYRLSPITYWLLKTFGLLKVSNYSLPNLLAGKQIVEEYIQHAAMAGNLSTAIMQLITMHEGTSELMAIYHTIHKSIKKDASQEATKAIAELIG